MKPYLKKILFIVGIICLLRLGYGYWTEQLMVKGEADFTLQVEIQEEVKISRNQPSTKVAEEASKTPEDIAQDSPVVIPADGNEVMQSTQDLIDSGRASEQEATPEISNDQIIIIEAAASDESINKNTENEDYLTPTPSQEEASDFLEETTSAAQYNSEIEVDSVED